MATNRLEILKKRLDLYLKAEEAILSGAQSYTIGSRTLTRGDLQQIRTVIKDIMDTLTEEEAVAEGKARHRTVGVVFRDW